MSDTIKPVTWSVGTCNFLHDLTFDQWKIIASFFDAQADWIAGQEVDKTEIDDAIDAVLSTTEWSHSFRESENPLLMRISKSRRKTLSKLPAGLVNQYSKQANSGIVFLHPGMTGISPHRDMPWIATEFVENPIFTTTIFAGSHWVSGELTDQPEQEYRTASMNTTIQVTSDKIKEWNDLGLNVMLCVDTNWHRGGQPPLGDNMVNLAGATIDKILWFPCATSNFDLVKIGSTEAYDTPSDHDFRVVNVSAVANDLYPETTNLSLTDSNDLTDPTTVYLDKLTVARQVEAWIAKSTAELRDIVKDV